MTDFTPPTTPPLPPLAAELAASLARHAMTAAGGFLVSHGVLTQASSDQLVSYGVGALLILAGAAWSWVQKHNARKVVSK